MSQSPSPSGATVSRGDVASGAGLAALSRLGAVIEIVSVPAFTWMFGVATYGVYAVLWALVNILSRLFDLSMGQALQRVVPAQNDRVAQHGAVRFAIVLPLVLSVTVAAIITLFSGSIAGWIAAGPADKATLPLAIAVFAWALPLWVLVEVATSAARAMRAFGPEIRLRIFWEQLARLVFAAGFFLLGFQSTGLLFGHLLSLALTAALSLHLLGRFYDLRLLFSAPVPRELRRDLLASGLGTMPPNLARRAFNDLPPVVLNLLLAGQAGATAAGLFAIARKIASIPLIVRQAFQYVLAPLASSQAAKDKRLLAPIYSFSNHVSLVLVLPLTALLILLASDILSLFAPEAIAALPVLVVLLIARAGEAIFGPATPIVEMTGHRGLPLLNSVVGLSLWIGLGWWLVPGQQATGMAVAVAVGAVATAVAATVELDLTHRIHPFTQHFWTGLTVALFGIAILYAAGLAMAPLGATVRAIVLLLLFWPILWLCLRFGLDNDDRAALGKMGRRLHL